MSLQKRYMKFKRVTCQHSLRWHFKHRGIYHYVVQISCSWYFIEPCIWNLSTEYKNNKRKQTNGIQHLCESHALYRMILFFHHITTQAHTDTNTDTCLETGKLCGTFSPSRCATDVIFSCTIRWWVSPATGWARVSFLVFDVKTILHLSILAHSALGMRMLHQRSLRLHAFWFGQYYYLYLCISCDAFGFATSFPCLLFLSGVCIPRRFPVAWYTHLWIVCVQNSTVVMESISVGSIEKFGSLTETLNRIGSFASNDFSLLHYLFSRVVFHQIPNRFFLIQWFWIHERIWSFCQTISIVSKFKFR